MIFSHQHDTFFGGALLNLFPQQHLFLVTRKEKVYHAFTTRARPSPGGSVHSSQEYIDPITYTHVQSIQQAHTNLLGLALSAAPMAASARSSATASPIRPTSARRGPSAARVIGASRGSRAQALTSGEQTACPDNERATCGRARVRRHRGRAAGLGGAVRPLSLPALLGGTAV